VSRLKSAAPASKSVDSVAQLFAVDIDEDGVASNPRQITRAPFSLRVRTVVAALARGAR
jgi:hypothetical protein